MSIQKVSCTHNFQRLLDYKGKKLLLYIKHKAEDDTAIGFMNSAGTWNIDLKEVDTYESNATSVRNQKWISFVLLVFVFKNQWRG